MTIDATIYVNRPDVVSLDPERVDYADLGEAVHAAAAGATEISILAGYYRAAALVDVCRQVPRGQRRACRVRIAVGLEATALIPRTWEDMRAVQARLRELGVREVTVAVVMNAPVHFHTKLVRILRTTRPVWFVGSANPGSHRHKLMVRISGRHDALSGYVDAVFQRASPVSGRPPEVAIGTLRDFFLDGALCHKPPIQRLLTFDAYRFGPEDRERLAEALAGGSGVEHARPRTEGFGFGLRSALGLGDDLAADDVAERDDVVQRIHYRRSCVDTALGLWMPRPYARDVADRIKDEEAVRLMRLETLAHALESPSGQEAATRSFAAYLGSMDRFLATHRIGARPVKDRDAAFARFLRSRTTTFGDDEARRRLARVMVITEMPDIWGDERAAEAFETSFFDDLAYRSGTADRERSRVVRSLVAALGCETADTGEELRGTMAERLSETPWTNDLWEF